MKNEGELFKRGSLGMGVWDKGTPGRRDSVSRGVEFRKSMAELILDLINASQIFQGQFLERTVY